MYNRIENYPRHYEDLKVKLTKFIDGINGKYVKKRISVSPVVIDLASWVVVTNVNRGGKDRAQKGLLGGKKKEMAFRIVSDMLM